MARHYNIIPLSVLLLALALATAASAQTTAPAHSNSNKSSSKCAKTFDGCLRCDKATTTCTKCRANSTWDDVKQACVCNSDDGNWGTITKEIFDQYVNLILCPGKKHCKRPKYSSVAGKCVKCDKYFGDLSIDGACTGLTGLFRDTKLTIKNGIPDPGTGDWSSAWIVGNIGACTLGCNADPTYLVPRNLAPGASTTQQSWNGGSSADVTADLKFCSAGWTLPDICLTAPTIIRVEAGNPKLGFPWVTIGGINHNFYKRETWEIEVDGHKFSVTRNNDLDAAIDTVLTVLS